MFLKKHIVFQIFKKCAGTPMSYTTGEEKIDNPENKIIMQFGPFENEIGHGALQSSVYPPPPPRVGRCACNKNKMGPSP